MERHGVVAPHCDQGLAHVVGITSAVVVWPPGVTPLLPKSAFHSISWREGSNELLTGRFAALKVRCAGGNVGKARPLPEQWLLIEWPADQAEPETYDLSTRLETTALNDLVHAAHLR